MLTNNDLKKEKIKVLLFYFINDGNGSYSYQHLRVALLFMCGLHIVIFFQRTQYGEVNKRVMYVVEKLD